jgi:hypothetical protein
VQLDESFDAFGQRHDGGPGEVRERDVHGAGGERVIASAGNVAQMRGSRAEVAGGILEGLPVSAHGINLSRLNQPQVQGTMTMPAFSAQSSQSDSPPSRQQNAKDRPMHS